MLLSKFTNLHTLILKNSNLGVAGGIHLNEFLGTNNTIKTLDISGNKIEVDGGRNLGKVLSTNNTLEFVDLGWNKIRDEGLKKIAEGISSNPESKVKCLGLRSNMLSDSAFQELFSAVSKNTNSKLNCVLYKGNSQTDYYLPKHIASAQAYNKDIFVDFFKKAEWLSEERLSRTIWVENKSFFALDLKQFLEKEKVGVILNIRERKGRKYQTIPTQTTFYIVEFAHALSADKAMILVSKKQNIIKGQKSAFYKAGSSTFFFNSNCKSSKFKGGKVQRK